MSNQTHHSGNTHGHGDFERQDIGVSTVVYFFLGLAVACVIAYFIVDGLYSFLDKRMQADQPAISPLVTNAPTDVRHVPRDYPQSVFPSPKLEEDERGQLDGIRLQEEQTLATYDYVDQKSGVVRIPIDRAMDLIAQRGLPVRQGGASQSATQPQEAKGNTKK